MNYNVFKAYDVRGIYPSHLNEEFAYKLGRAVVSTLTAKKVIIGRDMRNSSESLFQAVSNGILNSGAEVTDIGLCTTPMVYFSVPYYEQDCGIMITASHNPSEWNGFKITNRLGITLGLGTGLERIRDRMLADEEKEIGEVKKLDEMSKMQGIFEHGQEPKVLDMIKKKTILTDYENYFVKRFLQKHTLPKLKVVIDASNGVGSIEGEILRKIDGIEVIPLFFELDGTFPNHEANPLKEENMRFVQSAVLKNNADFGLMFDGDADRAGFVDENGKMIPSDLITAFIAQSILKDAPDSSIVYDVRSSRVVKEVITANNGKPVVWKVGHARIKQKMQEVSAVFGGELAGHYYFPLRFRDVLTYSDSSLLAVLHVMSLLRNGKMSELIAPLRKYVQSGEVNSRVEDKDSAIGRVKNIYQNHPERPELTELDGLTVEFDDRWFNLRKSNTEPLLRLNVEASTQDSMERLRDDVLGIINSG